MTATADLGFADGLGAHGDRLALVAPDGSPLTYGQLDTRVSTVVERMGPTRRLVLLAAGNDAESVVTYLAAVRGGHPVLLAAPGQVAALTAAYDPDLVIDGTSGWDERRPGTAHQLHPELALLLSTSGSTGSPKLVRLSADNLRANAAAIAEYLDIRATDRAMVSLPMHYCYGLSVVNSNLLRGAGLVLTNRSVVDPEFWAAVREHQVTSLHGVPHTFDLFDTIGLDTMELPSLRYVTQAGGRMDPGQVTRYVALGERRGWRLFVMYGQTEATARMAYLPPDLAHEHPATIGVPIPGGRFDIADDGELIYHGPNVMLGYAHGPADLALGRTTTDLATGDVARRTPDGLYEVIGRKSRFLKLFGLRVDLDQVERVLADDGIPAACTGTDDLLVVAVRGDVRRAAELVGARFGLRGAGVRIHRVDEIPLLPNGKVDYPAIAGLGRTRAADSVREVFATVLDQRDIADDATFVSLGGDSLSYVRMSIALSRLLGHLPANWPTTPVADLQRGHRSPARVPMLETNIVLRAVAIVLVVGSHIGFFGLAGGAHVLLLIAGWNFARFLLPAGAGRIARGAALIAAPAVAWLAYRVATTDDVTLMNVLLVNNFVGTGAVGYWFIEVLVHALAVLAILFALPALRRAERAHGFAVALVAVGVALLFRLGVNDAETYLERNMTTLGAVWVFMLGWLAQRASTVTRRCVVLAIAAVLIPIVLDHLTRGIVMGVGLVLLVVVARVPVPKPVVPVVSVVASASLYIYLTHYAVFPPLLHHLPPSLVVVLSVVAGVLAWQCVRLGTWFWSGRPSLRSRLPLFGPWRAVR